MADNVKHPSHYTEGRKYEPKDVIRDWNLNFNLGSAVKYISRAGRKDDIVQDLKKAQEFIQFEIDAINEERLIESIERDRFAEANLKGENKMKIVLDKGAKMPTRAHETDAGLDLYTPYGVSVSGGESYFGCMDIGWATIDTGVHVEIPKGFVGFIKSKSGLNVKHGLIAEGVIDSGYTGSIVVKLYNLTSKNHYFKAGDKIAQLVLLPIITPELELVDALDQTDRGDNGFGSTGV